MSGVEDLASTPGQPKTRQKLDRISSPDTRADLLLELASGGFQLRRFPIGDQFSSS
jgi:hypothetical protein